MERATGSAGVQEGRCAGKDPTEKVPWGPTLEGSDAQSPVHVWGKNLPSSRKGKRRPRTTSGRVCVKHGEECARQTSWARQAREVPGARPPRALEASVKTPKFYSAGDQVGAGEQIFAN